MEEVLSFFCSHCKKSISLDSSLIKLKEETKKKSNDEREDVDIFLSIFSATSGPVEHPLCEECCKVIYRKQQNQLEFNLEEEFSYSITKKELTLQKLQQTPIETIDNEIEEVKK